MSRGVFIGRFQPFHNGHLYAIKKIFESEDEVIIMIGSAQESFTLKNPLTTGERIEIIREVLKNLDLIDKSIIVPIPDIFENLVWPARILEYAPKFNRVYSGNELVLMLFERFGIETVRIEHINRGEFQGRIIREKIIKGEQWDYLVPKVVYEKLKEFDFENRIKRLTKHYGRGDV